MANSKISALTAATTPLAGTEVLPIVQSSATTKVTVANLTAGRAVSALSVTTTADSTINGLNVGKGGGAVASNTSVGFQALNGNATGFQMVAVGYQAGAVNTANNFTAVGYQAGLVNTTGGINTFLGFKTGVSNVDGGGITAVGDRALQTNISGNFNVGVGTTALGLATGSNCTGVGYNAGSTATSGNNNGFFGFGSAPSSITVSNEYTYGNASVTSHRFTAGNINVLTGNVIQGTAAKGFDFSANTPLAGKTSTLLNWYEEGTFTPNQGAGLTLVGAFSSTGKYTRIGRQVSISGTVTGATSVAVTAAGVITSNLPFTVGTAGHGNATNAAVTASAAVICTGTSVTSATALAATGTITFSATYFV